MRRVFTAFGIGLLLLGFTLSLDTSAAEPEGGKSVAAKPKAQDSEKAPQDTEKSKPSPAKKPKKASQSEDTSPQKPAPKKTRLKVLADALGEALEPLAEEGPEPKVAAKRQSADKAPADKTKAAVAHFRIKGSYPEAETPLSLFGTMETSLRTMLERMDKAANDKDVSAVLLRIEGTEFGRGKLEELRAAVARLRKAKKPVYAVLTGAEPGDYLLACACDEIVMVPSGTLMIPGVRAEVMFYKGLLDWLGIEVQLFQMGKYKGASEPFTRKGMSPAMRKDLGALVDDLYAQLIGTIAADRKLDSFQVSQLVDEGFFTAQEAKKAGLVDHVMYADQFRDVLAKRLKTKELTLLADYGKKKEDLDFSGISGMMKMMETMFGGGRSKPRATGKRIAVVYATGMIVSGKGGSSIFGDELLGADRMVDTLRKAADDSNVLAIVFRVDSPGGSAIASDLIWREIVRINKPVIASMGDVAGSGGYYILMGADKIFAEPGTLTGSIGVVGGKLVLKGLYEKIGLSVDVISRGKTAGMLSSSEPFTPDQRETLEKLLRETYDQFVDKAAQGRKMDRKKMEKLAQGRVYTGRMAAENGLVDAVGTLEDAIAEAKKAAGVKPDEKVDVLILPEPKSIFEQLFGEASLSTYAGAIPPDLRRAATHAETLRRLFAEPTLTLMPYRIHVK